MFVVIEFDEDIVRDEPQWIAALRRLYHLQYPVPEYTCVLTRSLQAKLSSPAALVPVMQEAG